MKINNALIILWKGDQITDSMVQKLAEFLTLNGICTPEMLTIKYKDEEAIAKALIRDVISANDVNIVKSEDADLAEAVKQSVIYIGKRFENVLSGTNNSLSNIAMFAIELSNAVITAKRNTSFLGVGTNDELLTAIQILSTTNAVIPASLARKYHFNQNVINVIKKIYNSY